MDTKNEEGEKRIVAIPWKPKDPHRLVRGYEYEMRTYFDAIVIRYCEIAGIDRISLKFAQTPFIDEAKDPSGVVAQESKVGGSSSGHTTAADPSLPEEAAIDGPLPPQGRPHAPVAQANSYCRACGC
jgi:hypothetical protein